MAKPRGGPHKNVVKEVEQRLGQYCFALGQGAAGVRVSRATIRALIDRYQGPLTGAVNTDNAKKLDRWEDEGDVVLDLVAAVGRLAALSATAKGLMTISPKHFRHAARLVESNVPRAMGDSCP